MDGQAPGALDRWRQQLEGWAIPETILAAAPESPWGFPVGLFRSRARRRRGRQFQRADGCVTRAERAGATSQAVSSVRA